MKTLTIHHTDLRCPFCETLHKKELYPIIDLVERPSLKLGILTDSLFTIPCSQCNNRFVVSHEMIVHDKEASFALLLAPDSKLASLERPDLDVHTLDTLRLVSSTDELKEKILLLDANLDDRAIELCKMYLLMKLERPGHSLLYAGQQDSASGMLFTLFDEQGEMQESVQCPDELYIQLLKTAQEFPLTEGIFVAVNQLWAYTEIKNSARPAP